MRSVLAGLAATVVAFLAGYWPMQSKVTVVQQEADRTRQQLETRVAETQERLRVAQLQNQLGLLLLEVEQNNFGKAREISTVFFDEVRSALFASKNTAIRSRLESALKRRDQVTADLTMAKPGSAETLRQFYAEFLGTGEVAPPR